jgi:hypothetical protein
VLGGFANKTLCRAKGNNGRSDARAAFVRDDFDAIVLIYTNTRVGRAEIDANNLAGPFNGWFIVAESTENEKKEHRDLSDRLGDKWSDGFRPKFGQ